MIPNIDQLISAESYSQQLDDRIRQYAITYVERFNMSVVPIDGKTATRKWKELQTRRPTHDELIGWQWPGIGIITGEISDLVVVDCDNMKSARWFYVEVAKTPSMVRTKRGVHFYFRHPGRRVKNAVHVRGKYDIRGDGGLSVALPSPGKEWIDGYGLRHQRDLPPFLPEWLPDKAGHAAKAISEKEISFPEKYIAKIFAISGHAGHDETYKAVSYLRDAGLSKFEAAMIIARWNLTNADPPWSDAELAHKLDDVFGC